MKKIITFLFLSTCATSISFAQDDLKDLSTKTATTTADKARVETKDSVGRKLWKIKNTLLFNIEQNYYDNWSAGGVGSFSFSGTYNGFYNYRKGKMKWDNSAEISYGKSRQDITGEGIFDPSNEFRKTDDKVELNSIFGYKAFRSWNYSALANFKTQMDNGYVYGVDTDNKTTKTLVSSAFSPAILTTSLGMEYKPKPYFSMLVSPLTGRTTIVLNNDLAAMSTKFGMREDGRHIDFAFGSYVKFFFEKDVFKNVHVLAKLEFFSDYRKDNFIKETDVNFETLVTMKVNKYLSTFLNIQWMFDKDFNAKRQFKQRFGITIPLTF